MIRSLIRSFLVGLGASLALPAGSAPGAEVFAVPSSMTVEPGDPGFAVELFVTFGPFEAAAMVQLEIDLIDTSPATNKTTFPVPGPPGVVLTTPLGGWTIPFSSLNAFEPFCPGPPGCLTPTPANPPNYSAEGHDFAAKPAGLTIFSAA